MFERLLPGEYSVREVVPAGFVQTTANPGPVVLDAWEEDAAVAPETDRTAVHAKVDTWQIYMFKDRANADGLH